MKRQVIEINFGTDPIPLRIEDDAMFKGWTSSVPRLWFLGQRQATRLDGESLFGAQEYAVRYNRAIYLVLAPPTQSIAVGARGYSRSVTRVIPVPTQSLGRTVDFIRNIGTTIAPPVQTVRVVRPSGSPVNPVPAPPPGADLIAP